MKGLVVVTLGLAMWLATPGHLFASEPAYAVIVGPDTASSAEIFAGALHRQGRAMLVGQSTYGKCSSQTDARLSDGSVLRYTNRDVLLPDGKSCSGAGLVPDRQVSEADMLDLAALVRVVEDAIK